MARVVPISDEESLSFLQFQQENSFFEDLTREDSLVSNNNVYLDSTAKNIPDFQPKPYIPSNYRLRPALGGPLVKVQPVQNIYLEQSPSFYSQTHLFYQKPEDNFEQQKKEYQQQETKISFFNLPVN